MKKLQNHLKLFFQRVMADDTDILEAASGFAGIGFVLLMSDHDAHTYLVIPPPCGRTSCSGSLFL